MKYHAIPTPRQLPKDVNINVRHSVNQLIKELIRILAKLSKKDSTNFPILFYLHDHNSMLDLRHRLVDGDELIVHAEGSPFLIGPAETGQYTLTPFQLALLLNENKLPDLDINIHLLSCNSATEYNGNNYTCDTSKALNVFFRYHSISVTGYTGFIEVKSNAKFAVSSVLGRSTKGTHSDLDSAKIVYKNGRVCFRNKIMINTLSNMMFSWAEHYIKQTNRERKLVETIQQAAVVKSPDFVPRARSQDSSFNSYGIVSEKRDKKPVDLLRKSNSHHFFFTAQYQDKSIPITPENVAFHLN